MEAEETGSEGEETTEDAVLAAEIGHGLEAANTEHMSAFLNLSGISIPCNGPGSHSVRDPAYWCTLGMLRTRMTMFLCLPKVKCQIGLRRQVV